MRESVNIEFNFSQINFILSGAVKFGEQLSSDICSTLLQSLWSCNMPFQCAHGRPLLAPLTNVAKLAHIGKQVRYINFVWIVFLSRHNLDVTYNLKIICRIFKFFLFSRNCLNEHSTNWKFSCFNVCQSYFVFL